MLKLNPFELYTPLTLSNKLLHSQNLKSYALEV